MELYTTRKIIFLYTSERYVIKERKEKEIIMIKNL
jgi:hypothetical protein